MANQWAPAAATMPSSSPPNAPCDYDSAPPLKTEANDTEISFSRGEPFSAGQFQFTAPSVVLTPIPEQASSAHTNQSKARPVSLPGAPSSSAILGLYADVGGVIGEPVHRIQISEEVGTRPAIDQCSAADNIRASPLQLPVSLLKKRLGSSSGVDPSNGSNDGSSREAQSDRSSARVQSLSSSDTAVMATTDDAVASKFSAAALGYFDYDAISFFAPNRLERRQPLINRGYYARVSIIRKLLCEFFDAMEIKPGPFQVVNLGAGMDPVYYWLISVLTGPHNADLKVKAEHLRYYEVDFPEVLARKAAIVASHRTLKQPVETVGVQPEQEARNLTQFTGGMLFTTPTWKLVGADMRDIPALDAAIKKAGLQTDLPTFFLIECVLAYMPTPAADALLRWTATAVLGAPCVVVNYDPFRPNDRFGKMMKRNFLQRGCPLLSISDYPDVESLQARFRTAGYDEVSISDTKDIYKSFLDKVDVLRIEQLELFDELEEWTLIQEHYYVAVAVRHQAGRQDFGVVSRLVDYWGQSPEENHLSMPRFSTADARRSTHSELLAEAASAMLYQRNHMLNSPRPARAASHVPVITEWRLHLGIRGSNLDKWNGTGRGGLARIGSGVESSDSQSGPMRQLMSHSHASAPEFGNLTKSDSYVSLTGATGSHGLLAVVEEDDTGVDRNDSFGGSSTWRERGDAIMIKTGTTLSGAVKDLLGKGIDEDRDADE